MLFLLWNWEKCIDMFKIIIMMLLNFSFVKQFCFAMSGRLWKLLLMGYFHTTQYNIL